MAPPEAAARVNAVPASPESIARGARIFAANCVTCHGASGKGDGPLAKGLDPKPANLAAMATQHSDGDFAWKVAHGRGAMPAWKDILSQEEIWHTVNYIKSLGSPTQPQAGSAQHSGDGHQHAAPGTEAPR
jgi:mono/diheme cytochrome c family protein